MKRWAFTVFATNKTHFVHCVAVLKAKNQALAFDLALRIAKKAYPPARGWCAHSVAVHDVNEEVTLESVEVSPDA